MEDVTSNDEILFLFLSLGMVPWNSTSGGFAYIWQSKWVGIIAIKTEGTQIHFLSDVLVAVASLDLNVPNNSMCSCWSFYSLLFCLSNCLKAHNTCTNIIWKYKKKYSVCNLVCITFFKIYWNGTCTTQADLYVLLHLDAWLQNPHVTNMHTFQHWTPVCFIIHELGVDR